MDSNFKTLLTIRDDTIDIMYECYNESRGSHCQELKEQYFTLAKKYEDIIANIEIMIKAEVELCQLKK